MNETTSGLGDDLGYREPSEAWLKITGGDLDPYPDLADARRDTPVLAEDVRPIASADSESAERWRESKPTIFTIYKYEDVDRVLRDHETFSSSTYAGVMGPVMGHTILELDPPEHTLRRGLVHHAFRKRALQRWEEKLIAPETDALIDEFIDRGSADLQNEFSAILPVKVIAGILGLPSDDFSQFLRWSMDLIAWAGDYERGVAASKALGEYFAAVLDGRRKSPQEDVISDLAAAEIDGERLTDEEIYSFLRLLLPAGAETTARSFGNLMFGLLTHPEQLEAVRADRSLVKQAIEEAIRWETPLLFIQRAAAVDTEIRGVEIPKGALISICLGSANRDEEVFENPDDFDIHRGVQQHLAFGAGHHMCVGQQLARSEMTIELNAVLDRLANLRLDPEWDDPHIRGFVFRSPLRLPVLFEPI